MVREEFRKREERRKNKRIEEKGKRNSAGPSQRLVGLVGKTRFGLMGSLGEHTLTFGQSGERLLGLNAWAGEIEEFEFFQK